MDPGLRQWAQPGKMQGNGQRIGTCARFTWLPRELRNASPTYRSTIDDDQRATDLICWMGTKTAASQRAPETYARASHGR